jgi:cytochrome c oxidase subunit 1
MILAGICGAMLIVAWVCFLVNVIMSIGLNGLLRIFTKTTLDTTACVPVLKIV